MIDRTVVSGVSGMWLAGLVQHLFGVTVVRGDEQDVAVFFARVVHSPDGDVYDGVFIFLKKRDEEFTTRKNYTTDFTVHPDAVAHLTGGGG